MLPVAGKLQGALADWLGDGLVRRDGIEPFGRGFPIVTQEPDQTQRLPLRLNL